MKLAVYLLLTVSLFYSVKATCDLHPDDFENDAYWGYWGVNLNETDVPNFIWDSTDSVQINIAHSRNMRIFFNLQDLIFDYNATYHEYTVKTGWKTDFDTTYGKEATPINPYGITGFVPAGFFLGKSLMWYGVTYSEINSIAAYVKSKYSTPMIMYDEHYKVIEFEVDYHSTVIPAFTAFPGNVNFVMISNFWPDTLFNGITSADLVSFHASYVFPRININTRFFYTMPMYTTSTSPSTSCHPPVGQTCVDVMASYAQAYFDFMCLDGGCYSGCNDPSCTITVYGLTAWHWQSDPNLTGYETGLVDIPTLRTYEQYFGGLACTLNPASSTAITLSVLASAVLFSLMF